MNDFLQLMYVNVHILFTYMYDRCVCAGTCNVTPLFPSTQMPLRLI